MRKIYLFFAVLFACATMWADPITVRLKASSVPSDWSEVAIHYWGGPKTSWPGEKLTEKDGWYSKTFADSVTTVNIIWNNNKGGQTIDIENVTASTCYELGDKSGNKYTVTTIECPETKPEVILSVEGKTFVDSTLTFSTIVTGFSGTPTIVYSVKVGEGAYTDLQGNTYTITAAGEYMVKATATYGTEEATAEQSFTAMATPDAITVRLRAVTLPSDWGNVYIHFWGDESSTWPGEKLTAGEDGWYTKTFSSGCTTMNIIWHNGSGKQTSDITGVTASTCYENTSNTAVKVVDCSSEPGPGPEPETKTYYITGNAALVGESLAWKADALAMTDSTHTFMGMAAGTYEMKITDGKWKGDGGQEFSFDNVDVTASSAGVYSSGENKNIGFVVETPNNVVVKISNGVITITGTFKTEDPGPGPGTVDYYLVGYINGEDKGCGDTDWETLHAEYKFVEGSLTATFTDTSYVYVKTSDNKNWYMSATYVPAAASASATLMLAGETVSEKLGVPTGVVTFSLVANGDDTLTLSYTSSASALTEMKTKSVSAKKVMIDGTLYILREGKMYSVLGQE